jgi:hypothetical protein
VVEHNNTVRTFFLKVPHYSTDSLAFLEFEKF